MDLHQQVAKAEPSNQTSSPEIPADGATFKTTYNRLRQDGEEFYMLLSDYIKVYGRDPPWIGKRQQEKHTDPESVVDLRKTKDDQFVYRVGTSPGNWLPTVYYQ